MIRMLILEGVHPPSPLLFVTIQQATMESDVALAVSVSDAQRQLEANDFDVILAQLDLSCQDESLRAIRCLRSSTGDLPIVVIAEAHDNNMAVQALAAGAQDVLAMDGLTPELLERSVLHSLERAQQRRVIREEGARMEQLLDASNRFVDNVSHEFRTPLTVIREYASLMQDGLLGSVNNEQGNFLEIIADRADDLSNMVDDMLDSSKIAAGILGISRCPVHMHDVMESVRHGLERKAVVRNVQLSIDLSDDLPEVFCDPEKAGRVITNLTTNAIKFSCEPGTVDITVTADPTSREVRVSVADNGPGIAARDLQLLFERFRQLGTSTQSSTKGFGLGLNIARELVDLNFGQIDVASRPGHGSTFTFTLPVNEPDEILRRYMARLGRIAETQSLVCMSARVPQSTDGPHLESIDAFWRYTLRRNDLVLRRDSGSWSLYLPMDCDCSTRVVQRIQEEHRRVGRNRPQGPLPPLTFAFVGYFEVSNVEAVINSFTPRLEPAAPHLLSETASYERVPVGVRLS